MLKLRQKTENLREGVHMNKSAVIRSGRYKSQQRTVKNIASQPEVFHDHASHSRQDTQEPESEDTTRWRRVSLNARNELTMVQSSFNEEVDKIAEYESKTKDYMGKYVKNLETLIVLQLNDELRRRSLKETERRTSS